MLPALFSLGFWIYKPLVETFRLSLYERNLRQRHLKPMWERKFRRLFSLPEMGISIWNTLLYMIGVLPFSIILPLFIAIATDNIGKRSRNVYRALIFLPMIMAPVAVSSVWRWILHPTNGILNQTLGRFIPMDEPIRYFTDERIAIWSIIL